MAAAAGIVRPPNNLSLVSYWSFNEGVGSVAGDFSGNGNNGTLNSSPTWGTGKLGKGLSFSGSSQNVSATIPASASTYTVSAWIKYQGAVPISTIKVALGFGSGTADATLWMGYASDGSLAVSDSQLDLKSSTIRNSNEWQHVVAVVSGGILTAYANGVSIGSTGMSSRSSNALIVGNYPGNGFPFNGAVDEVRIYSRALTSQEVGALYMLGGTEAMQTVKRGLTGYWPLNETTGSTARDLSGNNKTATLFNSPTWTTSGKYSNALTFGASNNYASTSVTWPSSGTISLWAYPTSIADWRSPGGWKSGVGEGYGYALIDMGNASRWRAVFRPSVGGNPESNISGISTFSINNWYHLVMTWRLVAITYTIRFYVNGVYQGETTWDGFQGANGLGNFHFGNSGDYPDNYFAGNVDEVRTYNRALSDTEVQQLYNGQKVLLQATTRTLQAGSTLANGLTNLWSFDGPDISGTTATDRAGTNNGTLTSSPTKVAGRHGQALAFNGTSCVTTGKSLSSASAFTVSGWVRPSEAGNRIGFFGQNDVIEFGFEDSDTIGGWTGDGGPSVSWDFTSATFAFDSWHHVVLAGSANGKYLYVDGQQVDSDTGASNFGSSAYTFNVGGCGVWDATGNGFTGAVDDVRVYNRALTPEEVKQLYLLGGKVLPGDGGGDISGNPAA